MVWVCWPENAAQKALDITSDLDENKVRDLGLELGFVDVKVAAVDDTWLRPEVGAACRPLRRYGLKVTSPQAKVAFEEPWFLTT